MPLIYITGVPGTGKSSVRKELQKRGYEAHDTDENGFRGWVNLKSNKRVDTDIRFPDATREWLKTHQLYIKREQVEKIVPTKDKVVFLCGTVPNEQDILDLFDKVIFLDVGNDALLKRINSRTNNIFGKHPDDLKDILKWNKESKAKAKRFGATMVNGEQTLEKVVNEIIASIDNHS